MTLDKEMVGLNQELIKISPKLIAVWQVFPIVTQVKTRSQWALKKCLKDE